MFNFIIGLIIGAVLGFGEFPIVTAEQIMKKAIYRV